MLPYSSCSSPPNNPHRLTLSKGNETPVPVSFHIATQGPKQLLGGPPAPIPTWASFNYQDDTSSPVKTCIYEVAFCPAPAFHISDLKHIAS